MYQRTWVTGGFPEMRYPCSMVPLLVVDFDGTLAERDVGDALCERFASPGWAEAGARWLRGELSLPEAQRRMWAHVRASRTELVAASQELGALRDGAAELFEAASAGRLELVLASGGFDLYIEPLLGAARSVFRSAYYNELDAHPAGARPRFPHADLAAGPYAICKAAVLRRHHRDGVVAFAGDGSSDRSAADAAKELGLRIFTVTGSLLERHCNDRAVEHVSFSSFRRVLDELCATQDSAPPS